MYDGSSINTEKYSKIVSEIEKFIEAKKKKPTTAKGTVEKIDLSNKILTVKLQLTKQLDLSRGSLILIREDILLGMDIRATVRDIYNSILKIEIKTSPSQFENKRVVIDTTKTNVILERLRTIVESIKKGKISLDNIRILDLVLGEKKAQYSRKRVSFVSKKLNRNQKEAVTKSIEADDFHLIIGPPGTGKTYVIEELSRQFSKRNQKILITAWTNLAVDNMIKRLLKSELKNIVRIGSINEISPEVREHSIFEKVKKHRDWKEVTRQQKAIDDVYNTIPKVKEEMTLVQESINQIMYDVNVLNKEQDCFFIEKQKYQAMIHASTKHRDLSDISSINNEMAAINQKSEVCLALSKNILQMNDLHTRMPDAEKVQQLKKLTRSMKFSIFGKKVSSFFARTNDKELEKLKQEYEKNKKQLDEFLELQKRYGCLRRMCEKEFNTIYSDKNGHPDRTALLSEFELYTTLENQYLPVFREQERSNAKKRTSKINHEVYTVYLESLKIKIDLHAAKIKGLKTEVHVQINHKEELRRQYVNLRFSLDIHKRNVDKLKKAIISEIIYDADLIAATAISSCHYFLDNVTFDVMIMDEASQVASFMSLLPLSKCKKFILVGDNRQLQPIEEEGISKEMNLSIFNRIFEMHPDASTLLTIQYRMHESIAQIANEIFYEGKLRTSETVAERILSLKVSRHQFLNPKIPVVFVDTSKAEYYEDEVGTGCSNIKEAKYVAYIISLFVKKGIKTEDIGVVTPYVKQKFLIKEFLKDIKILDVEVDTVHKFQGREKDVIIMSFARSKKYLFPKYKLKFIENETLVNVAITRAKKKLILVGDSKTLCQSELLNNVVMKIGRENTIGLEY